MEIIIDGDLLDFAEDKSEFISTEIFGYASDFIRNMPAGYHLKITLQWERGKFAGERVQS